ncbi:helix-turn-helix transcriptional regulator [Streptomyces sp. NPDC006355]|uniref:helix-turn-helix domain-containing protein n=1 Tax=Streptomyces sp. NPDC006355 TaxID=3156758 RepID=UPI0033BE55A8
MSRESDPVVAHHFGALVKELAFRKGVDLSPGGGNHVLFADKVGMSPSAVSRMLQGKTLPHPNRFEAIAREVGCDVRDLLVAAGTVSSQAWSTSTWQPAQVLTPSQAADGLGITDEVRRGMFLAMVDRLRS